MARRITVDGAKVSGSTALVDFPLLVTIANDASLKTSPVGQVSYTTGVDIHFVSEDRTTLRDYEIEDYDGIDGTLVAWVRIPVLSAAPATTTIVMCYGDPAVTAPLAVAADVWDSFYMAVWHLSEQGSRAVGEFVDSTRNANHGQGGRLEPMGVPQRVTGMFGYGQSFDGDDDHIGAPHTPTLDLAGATEMTVEAWVRNPQGSLRTSGGICSKRGYGSGYRLATGDSGRYWCQFSGENYGGVGSTDPWLQGTPQHVAAILKGGHTFIFVDGDKDPREATGPPHVESSPDDVLMIGHGDGFVGDRYSYPFLGVIDEVRISNAARTAAWIKTQHNNYDSPSTFYTVSPPL